MKKNWKQRGVQLLTGTALGFVLGGAAGLLVGVSYYLTKKYQKYGCCKCKIVLPQGVDIEAIDEGCF
ncbi:MAG TPA: hypothetical protein VFZ34_05565 [Blastocatellia bacterium]|nr:hypothetical protein [Blastocatellia bacterium]